MSPMRALQLQGFPIELFEPRHAAKYDVVIFSKLYDESNQKLAKHCRANGQRVILDLSDNHFYNPHQLKSYNQAETALDRMLGEVDLVTACSAYLAKIIRDRPSCHSPVIVVEDAVEELDVVRGKLRSNPNERLRLFWFGSHGSPNAESGLADLSRLSANLAGSRLPPHSFLTVMSNSREAYERVAKSIGIPSRYLDWDQDQFCDQLSMTDVVVLPITPTPFSYSKSNNRVATALRFGIPVIADHIPAYEPFSEFAYVDNWARGLADVIGCAPVLVERMIAGSAYVSDRCSNDAIAQQWRSAIEMVLSKNLRVTEHLGALPGVSLSKKHAPNKAVQPDKVGPYLSSPDQISQLKSLPNRAKMLGIPFERLVSKLKIERGLYEARSSKAPPAVCFILAADKADSSDLKQTLLSLTFQSHPNCRILFLSNEVTSNECASAVKSSGNVLPWTLVRDGDALRSAIEPHEMCFFVRSGEVLDPSLASVVSVYSGSYDVVTFGHVAYSEGTCESAIQILNAGGLTHDHIPIIGNAFSVRGERISTYPGDLPRELRINGLHLFQIWLRRRRGIQMIAHPEYMIFRKATLHLASTEWFLDYRVAYDALLSEDGKFRLSEHTASDPAPYHIVPTKPASGASVLIPFRDKPEMTIEAVLSVARHAREFPVEVILVNNNSTAGSMRAIESCLNAIPDLSVRVIDYPRAFNHSAQMNMGAEAAVNEVLVFMNNDCVIETPGIFDDLCAWAMADGIGTVGTRITNPKSASASVGIIKRLSRKSFYDSPVEEMTQPTEYQPFARRVFGNTFAFAAMSKARYLSLNGLNELHFPVGYNDVELAARCAAEGLLNICLGHLTVSHPPGQSRGGTDESTQKMFVHTLLGEAVDRFREDYVIEETLKGRPLYYQ